MKKTFFTSVIAVSALVASVAFAQSVETLRGAALNEQGAVQHNYKQQEGRFSRNYRQQPPLIPHTIDNYQIDLKANRCLSCHDWTTAGERRAPTLSMTHYLDRDGNQLDVVAGTRWFCSQCHVPQADAPALIDNTFEASN